MEATRCIWIINNHWVLRVVLPLQCLDGYLIWQVKLLFFLNKFCHTVSVLKTIAVVSWLLGHFLFRWLFRFIFIYISFIQCLCKRQYNNSPCGGNCQIFWTAEAYISTQMVLWIVMVLYIKPLPFLQNLWTFFPKSRPTLISIQPVATCHQGWWIRVLKCD